jgi:hypothetical protein
MAAPPVAVKADVIPGRCEASNYDVQLHIGESRDSGSGASAPSRNDAARHFPVFTLVHRRLMTRWVAGSRAVITNSFFSVASSG